VNFIYIVLCVTAVGTHQFTSVLHHVLFYSDRRVSSFTLARVSIVSV